jgi:hypothetical protein
MEQKQQGMQQQQYQGVDRRRQSQTQYHGEERRKPEPLFEEPTGRSDNGTPGMSTQERKEEQEERTRQQEQKHHDQL